MRSDSWPSEHVTHRLGIPLATGVLMPRAPEHRKPSLECIDRGLVEALLLEKSRVRGGRNAEGDLMAAKCDVLSL